MLLSSSWFMSLNLLLVLSLIMLPFSAVPSSLLDLNIGAYLPLYAAASPPLSEPSARHEKSPWKRSADFGANYSTNLITCLALCPTVNFIITMVP